MSYTRTPQPIVSKSCETLVSKCEIPIIDLAHMGTEPCPQKGVVKQVAKKLVRALSEKGLALLVNHGIPDWKIKAAYRALDTFCELPKEARAKFECVAPSSHGYIKPEPGTNPTDEIEARHEFIISGNDTELPDEDVPNFRSAVEELTSDFKQLSAMLLTALAVGMEQPSDYFMSKHSNLLDSGNSSSFRMIYYPPAVLSESGAMRYGPSCDTGTFTLLTQDCENGLEIQSPYGERWGRVGHLPGAILINSGDCLAKWTNQQLSSLKHRVVVPEHCSRGRHSIGFFVQPDENVEIEPLKTKISIPPQEPVICRLQKKKRGVLTAYHHLQRRFRETYAS
ncbi:2-oxoglutarate-dependent dioxygenase htyE [Chelonus insularis]|uniref:2-oxoglutarate-dependent dioxygenase htyE n=1 Tax=Chelonus insularis TaxID=460826 RepID=UPI00158D8949|nr:2-oxoglutarate-dependent dioxygenase htyE [Chelonus insularis]XP_034938726.1 2-oxoglutarate-dependent dioxygenase htyE [Chelonus insularis]